jgi:hypothetical protein
MSITDLVGYSFSTGLFLKSYKYASMHAHSSYPVIDDFRSIRGKVLDEKTTDSLVRLVLMITSLLIVDLTTIHQSSKVAFDSLEDGVKHFITGFYMANTITNNPKD